jgi:hypothetical protein
MLAERCLAILLDIQQVFIDAFPDRKNQILSAFFP